MKRLMLLFLSPALVCAELGPTTQYLMNEPASLFDIGMVRLENLIGYWEKQMTSNYKARSKSDPVGGNVNAYYRAEDDKIYVVLSTMDESATEEQMEAGCRYALQHIRIYVRKNLHVLFQHVGYRDPSEPAALVSTVGEMFELRCYVSGHSSSQGRFWATQTLRADEMTIGKWSLIN
jgi:hypothetical protein